MLWIFIAVLFLHFIGDFVCQNRWMADNKSKNWEALTLHVFVYSNVLLWAGTLSQLYLFNDLCRFTIINFIIHWLVDFTTSRYTRKALGVRNLHLFFAIIGADQFCHSITLLITTQYLLGYPLL